MRLPTCGVLALSLAVLLPGTAQAQPISVLTVDCTPFLSPGPSATFGPTNTMGLALTSPLVDPGATLFAVTEVDPPTFRAMTAVGLSAFDLIAVNNHPVRLGDPVGPLCVPGLGLGTTWHSAIGVASGGRVVLTSHDAPRFHMNAPPGFAAFGGGLGGFPPCPFCEPFGARI